MSENGGAKLPSAIPPTDGKELHLWLGMLYQVIRSQKQEMERMQERIKKLEDNQNG